MSHQPSTVDNIKSGAQNAYHAVAGVADEDTGRRRKQESAIVDDQGQVCEKGSFKHQLNEAAQGSGRTEADVEKEEEGYLEKGESFAVGVGIDCWKKLMTEAAASIPGIATLQKSVFGVEPEPETKKDPNECDNSNAPPQRPVHDVQVEEFLRTQYKSKTGEGMPELGSSDK